MKYLLFFFLAAATWAQTTLTPIGPASTLPNAQVPISVRLATGSGPIVALEWQTTPTIVWTLAPPLAGAKQISCIQGKCIVFGLNVTVIPSGDVALSTVVAPATGNISVALSNPSAANASGIAVPITVGPSLTVPVVLPPVLTSLSCTPASVASMQTATCTVSLDKNATVATVITVSSNQALLNVPPSATILPGTMNATFQAVAGTIIANVGATVTVALTSAARTFNLSLTAPVKISGDHNGDGRVTTSDMTMMVAEAIASAACDPARDMDGDKRCGVTDFVLTVLQWLKGGSLP